jgi:branched-chain amino acid transport system substrate-binding protein
MRVSEERIVIKRRANVTKRRFLSMFFPTLLVLLITIIVASCSPGQATLTPTGTATPTPGTTTTPTNPASESEVKTVKIGLLGSWTGAYAPGGLPHRMSIESGVKYWNEVKGGFTINGQKYKIELIEYDDRTDTKRAAAGITYLTDQHGIAMCLGPFSSPSTLAAQPIAEIRKCLIQSWAVADDATRTTMSYTWSWPAMGKVSGLTWASFMKQVLQCKTVAIITENVAYPLSVATGVLREWPKVGIDVIANETFESGIVDYSTIIARVRQKNPDVLFCNAVMGNNILLVRQIYQSGWKVLICGIGDLTTDDMFRANGPAANEIVSNSGLTYWAFKDGRVPDAAMETMGMDLKWYLECGDYFMDMWGDENMVRMIYGFNSVQGYIECMKKAGTTTDPVALRNAFEGLEWDSPQMHERALANHRMRLFVPMAVFYESNKADNFKLLGIATHTDDNQDNWVWTKVLEFPTVQEIRKTRGY